MKDLTTKLKLSIAYERLKSIIEDLNTLNSVQAKYAHTG